MWLLISLCIISGFSYTRASDCAEGCKEPILLYSDLNCKPVFSSPEDCCPSYFNCSYPEDKSDNKCSFRGKTYKIGESLNDNEIYENCRADCLCIEGHNGRAAFECATVDCPEWLSDDLSPGCYRAFELNKCCSTGQTCPPFNATCKVSDKIFYEGERFYPFSAKCTKCICKDRFQGKFEEPFCTKETCVEEIDKQKEIRSFCAPSYIRLDDCCPIDWICPANDDVITAFEETPNSIMGPKCKFGEKLLNVGDSLNRTSNYGGQLSCECRIPPYLTCIQNYQYSP